jgi:aminopeptidase N
MLVCGEATGAEMVDTVLGVLAHETSESLVEPYLKIAADTAELWTSESDRAATYEKVAATCRTLAEKDVTRQVALRQLVRVVPTLDEVAHLQEVAGKDVDLHWRILTRKAELGGETAGETEVLLERDTDPEAWIRALGVSAAAPDAGAKAEAWRRLAVDREVPVDSSSIVSVPFWRPGQEELLAPYADAYLELLPGLHRGGMTNAIAFTPRLFPLFGIDESFLARVAQVAAQAAPVVRQRAAEKADEVARMLRARSV